MRHLCWCDPLLPMGVDAGVDVVKAAPQQAVGHKLAVCSGGCSAMHTVL
jgi:hypothetical protein